MVQTLLSVSTALRHDCLYGVWTDAVADPAGTQADAVTYFVLLMLLIRRRGRVAPLYQLCQSETTSPSC